MFPGSPLPESTLFAHRETAPIFSYNLPPKFNIDQVFFGETISGRVSPVAADGYYLMLRPLKPGLHTIVFGGQSVDLSATSPQLGASAGMVTYLINVLPEDHSHGDGGHHGGDNAGGHDAAFLSPSGPGSPDGDRASLFAKHDGGLFDDSAMKVF